MSDINAIKEVGKKNRLSLITLLFWSYIIQPTTSANTHMAQINKGIVRLSFWFDTPSSKHPSPKTIVYFNAPHPSHPHLPEPWLMAKGDGFTKAEGVDTVEGDVERGVKDGELEKTENGEVVEKGSTILKKRKSKVGTRTVRRNASDPSTLLGFPSVQRVLPIRRPTIEACGVIVYVLVVEVT
jgi:hypothetical protein